MLIKKNNNVNKPNNSKPVNKSSKVLQLLQKIANTISDGTSGTIAYVFLSERIRFTEEFPEGEVYFNKSVVQSNINTEMFFKVEKGKKYRAKLEEVLQMIQDTCHDIGANYFIIN